MNKKIKEPTAAPLIINAPKSAPAAPTDDAMSAVFGKTNDTTIADIIAARLNPKTEDAADAASDEPIVMPRVGKIELVDPDAVVIGDRVRQELDLEELKASIAKHGQGQAILLLPNMALVHGYRRTMACKELGIPVVAHIVEVENPDELEIEEDRCRKAMTAWEIYVIGEKYRPALEADARWRKQQGKKLLTAEKRGRVDDLIADYFKISRGTYRKIKEIMASFEVEKERYAELVNQLQKDSKRIDRYYSTFKAMAVEPYTGPKLKALLVNADWQRDSEKAVASLVKLGTSQLMADDGLMLVPSAVTSIPSALQLISKSGGKLVATYAGLQPEAAVWSAVSFGKASSKLDEALQVELKDACDGGYDDVLAFVTKKFDGAATTISLAP